MFVGFVLLSLAVVSPMFSLIFLDEPASDEASVCYASLKPSDCEVLW